MTSIINTNLNSLMAQANLTKNQQSLATSMQRLSSGLRINSAADDAAGLAIASRFQTQINGTQQASRNANDGISLVQTADGALASIADNLQRMRQLSVQSANATNSSSDRAALQAEVTQLQQEIDRVATQTNFNGLNLLDGSFGGGASGQFQVGANAGQVINTGSIASARSSALGQFQGYSNATLSIGTASNTTGAASIAIGGTSYALGTIANDAKAIAAAATSANIPGLNVTANAAVYVGAQTVSTTAAGTSSFTLNGVTISVATSTSGATELSNAMQAINSQSAATGVMATNNGAGLTLTAADGRNITVAGFAAGTSTGTTIADFGITAVAVTGGSLNVQYVAPVGNTGTLTITGPAGSLLAATAPAATGTAVNAIDISTVAGANSAMSSLDAALASVNASRAQLGAVQNRFQSAISNLSTSNVNLTASQSRIQDADFAAETANLSRSQILQQAGTAMVAQANQLPQGVLALLR